MQDRLLGTIFAAAILSTADLAVGDPLPPGGGAGSPTFRGANGSGRYSFAGLPTSWNEAGKENVRWKVPLSLPGWGSPLVWNDRVVVTGADKDSRAVWCFGAKDGKLLWRQEIPFVAGACAEYATDTMDKDWDARMYAGATPATDGERVFALFSNGQLAALDMAKGNVLWNIALGDAKPNKYGLTSSPLACSGSVIVSFQGAAMFIAAYEGATGAERWKTERLSPTWASPILIRTAAGRDQVVLPADPDTAAWDPASGTRLWSVKTLKESAEYCVGPSPVFNGKLVFVNYEKSGIHAIDPDTGQKAWSVEELPSVGFPIGISMTTDGSRVYQFFEYYLDCLDAATGKLVKEQEFEESAGYASPFFSGGRLYLFTQGPTLVADADAAKGFPIMGKGVLDEPVHASPAVVEGAIFLRTDKSLYRLGL